MITHFPTISVNQHKEYGSSLVSDFGFWFRFRFSVVTLWNCLGDLPDYSHLMTNVEVMNQDMDYGPNKVLVLFPLLRLSHCRFP